MPQLSLVLPAYNERQIIAATIDELSTYMQEHMPEWTYEILVVDDGSTDGMADIVTALERPNIRIARHDTNRGRGAALQTGFTESKGEYILTLDTDLSYAPYHIKMLVEPIVENHADITLASAYHPDGSVRNVPFIRAKLSRYGNKVLSAGMYNKFSTVTCIVRAYRASAIKRLELINTGKDIHIEIVQKANLFGIRVLEIPAHLEWRDRRRAKRIGVGKRFPLLAMSGTIASHLIYNYVLRPGSLLIFPILLLLLIAALGSALLLINWVTLFLQLDGSGLFDNIYFSLRETLVHGAVTVAITVASAFASLIFLAFYFASHQNKQQFEELYILLARTNERLKELEDRQKT